MAGKRFGRLVATRSTRDSSRLLWECLCDCGKVVSYPAGKLVAGYRKSCGCLAAELSAKRNLTGRVYGRLTVLSRDTSGTSRRGKWLCRCTCGGIRSVVSYALTGGKTVSCGCYASEQSRNRALDRNNSHFNRLPEGLASFNALICAYKCRAREYKREWSLTTTQAKILFDGNCYYCGSSPKQLCGGKKAHGQYLYNGLDRLDNSIGYTAENAVSCCGPCNTAKRALSESEFLDLIARIYHNRIAKVVSA